MFGKLLKYEWRAAAHTLFPMYLLTLALSVINRVLPSVTGGAIGGEYGSSSLGNFIRILTYVIYVGVMVTLFALTFVVVVQRFYKGIVGDEGYLILTVPVRLWEIPLSKCVISLIFSLFSAIVAGVSILILAGELGFFLEIDWVDGFRGLNEQVPYWALYAVELALLAVISVATVLYHIYLSIMLGQLSNNNKLVMSFLWYVGINIVLSIINFAAAASGMDLIRGMSLFLTGNMAFQAMALGFLAGNVLQLAVFAGGTQYLMKKKMNI